MKAFAVARPMSAVQVLKLLAEGARPKGGGNDLLDLAKRGVATPAILVDLGIVVDMVAARGLRSTNAARPPLAADVQVEIGAITTIADVAADAVVRKECPILSDAAAAAATPQIRNTATVGGNLLQRPRCAYFRDPFFDCLKRGGTTCPARDGVHDEMAIFGNSKCCATHPSNLATAFVAADAWIHVLRRYVTRPNDGEVGEVTRVRADAFFVAPDADLGREADVGPGELLVMVVVPSCPVSAYVEVNQKQSYDWASVACAVVLDVDGGKIREARVALGAVAPVPFRAKAAEDALRGKPLRDEAAWDAAAEAATQGATPLPRNGHKVRQLRAVVRRAIAAAVARAK